MKTDANSNNLFHHCVLSPSFQDRAENLKEIISVAKDVPGWNDSILKNKNELGNTIFHILALYKGTSISYTCIIYLYLGKIIKVCKMCDFYKAI